MRNFHVALENFETVFLSDGTMVKWLRYMDLYSS